jgi:hypothetical protein
LKHLLFDSESIQLFGIRTAANDFTPRMCMKSQFFVPADGARRERQPLRNRFKYVKGETAAAISPQYALQALRFRVAKGACILRDAASQLLRMRIGDLILRSTR